MHTLAPLSTCRHSSIRIYTGRATEFVDVTDRIDALIADAGIHSGIVNIQTCTRPPLCHEEDAGMRTGLLSRAGGANASYPQARSASVRSRFSSTNVRRRPASMRAATDIYIARFPK